MLDLSVVIPTYNRRQLLHGLVESLRRQTHLSERYEIVIVSDGCTDGTDDEYATPLTSPLTRLVRQEKHGFGLSAARNLGLRTSVGRLVMFLDDDMVADEHLVEQHVQAHASNKPHIAVCGQVKLSPDLPNTPFCQLIIGDTCSLIGDSAGRRGLLPFQVALSWQTSFKREELERLGGYDDTFRSYGWEDIEFAYRATQRGTQFQYEPRAISFHRDQRNSLRAHAERIRNSSYMAAHLFARHPNLKPLITMYTDKGPIDWQADRPTLIAKKAARRMLATRAGRATLVALTPYAERGFSRWPWLMRRWYYGVLGGFALNGYREGLAAMGGRPAATGHRALT